LLIYIPDESWALYADVIGKSQAITLNVTDLQGVFEDLKSKEVNFLQEPDKQLWGTFTTFEDSEGNHIMLFELPTE
jgi:hypothetical protein